MPESECRACHGGYAATLVPYSLVLDIRFRGTKGSVLERLKYMTRTEFAERIAAGLAGWFQQLAAQNLERQVGEDASRVELVRMISAQQAYIPETGQRPPNWPQNTKKRIDLAVLGRRVGARGWYGAIELKWPGESIDVAETRKAIVEDAVRVAFAETGNLCANFLVLGGTTAALAALFDTAHPQAQDQEERRTAFNNLFHRDTANSAGVLRNAVLNEKFPDFGDRVPQTTFNGWSRRLKTELITSAKAMVGQVEKGAVFVWQCKK